MKYDEKMLAIARAILKHEGYSETDIVGGYPDEVGETNSRILFQVSKVYGFVVFDKRIRIGYEGVHFHFTEDGRYGEVTSFGDLLWDNGSVIKKLPDDVMPQ